MWECSAGDLQQRTPLVYEIQHQVLHWKDWQCTSDQSRAQSHGWKELPLAVESVERDGILDVFHLQPETSKTRKPQSFMPYSSYGPAHWQFISNLPSRNQLMLSKSCTLNRDNDWSLVFLVCGIWIHLDYWRTRKTNPGHRAHTSLLVTVPTAGWVPASFYKKNGRGQCSLLPWAIHSSIPSFNNYFGYLSCSTCCPKLCRYSRKYRREQGVKKINKWNTICRPMFLYPGCIIKII